MFGIEINLAREGNKEKSTHLFKGLGPGPL